MSKFEKGLMILGVLLITFLTVVTAKEAISDIDKMQTKIIFKELKASLKDLYKVSTLHYMQEMKNHFDKSLPTQDLAELNDLRFRVTELKKLKKAERKAFVEQIKMYNKAGIKFDREELKSRYSKYSVEYKKVHAQISEFSNKYKNRLLDIYQKYDDKFSHIRSKRHKIIQKWESMYAKELLMVDENEITQRYSKLERKTNPFMSDIDNTELTKLFLLWDGFSKAGY